MFGVKLAVASAMAGLSLVDAAGKKTVAFMHVYPSNAKVCFRVASALKDGKFDEFESVGPLTYLSTVQYEEMDDTLAELKLDLVAAVNNKCPEAKDEASLVGGIKTAPVSTALANIFLAGINSQGKLDIEAPRDKTDGKITAIADDKWMAMFMNFGKGFAKVQGTDTSGCWFKMDTEEVTKNDKKGEGDGVTVGPLGALDGDGTLTFICDGTEHTFAAEKELFTLGAMTIFMLVGEKGKTDDYAPKVIWASAKKGVGSWQPVTHEPTSAPTKKPATDARRRRTPTETDSARGLGVAGLPLAAMGLAHMDL